MGNIGSHSDLTSVWWGHQAKLSCAENGQFADAVLTTRRAQAWAAQENQATLADTSG